MSKRNQRSKNKADNNNINFVFKPDESLNRGLSFNGSVPGSPAASATGFNLSGNSFGSNNSQPFTFGAPASQPVGNAAFNFTTPSANSSPSSLKRGATEIPSSGTPEHHSLRRTTSEFSFGSTANAFGTPSNNPPFAFGSASSTGTDTNKAAAPNTGFGLPSNSVPASNTSAFAFTTGNSSESTTQPPVHASAFTFGNPSTTTGTVSNPTNPTPSAPATLSAAQTTTGSPFTFGSSTQATKPASTPAFSFGKPSETSIATSTPALSFGKPAETTSKSAAPTFSFGKPAETSASSAEPAKSTAEIKPASSGVFSFGTPASTSTAATSTKPTTSFTFGSTNTTTAPTTTISTTTAVPLSFGTSNASKPSSTNSSTAATTTSTASAATTVPSFTFGTSTTDTKKDDAKSAPLVTSSPFTFGTTATTSGATTSSTSTAALTTTAPLATTATKPAENKPNPFSFTKILEDLSKVATEQPSQVHASLITPSLSSLYQKQTVQHTSFRIDNISSSTRFTELPEQAQKELDELEKYIRTEGQRSEHIRNHGIPQQVQKMDKCRQDTESLSQKLDALSSTLKSRLESTQSLYDTVREQLRHANDGCAVIEACKLPGTSRRWLFGHSDDDDYFALIAKQMSSRVEEYKKCIWEIERTAESWGKNRAQSPQDIARIMHAQNQTFLALANKVAILHERVEREKEYYEQYLKAYS